VGLAGWALGAAAASMLALDQPVIAWAALQR
jgi:hypothetical protein